MKTMRVLVAAIIIFLPLPRPLHAQNASTTPVFTTASCGRPSCTWNAFGPQTFTRETGEPQAITAIFSILNPNTQYTLAVENSGVASAVISLNGAEIFGSSHFDPNVTKISKAVTLQLSNTLSVELRSKPGSSLSVTVVGVDNDPPGISFTENPPPNQFGWNNTDTSLSFACSDKTSGVAFCSSPVTLTTEGLNQIVSGFAQDRAGNSATVTIPVSIDKTPPTITSKSSPAPNAAGWNNTSVTVNFSCSDSLSGIATCPPAAVVTTEGANQTVGGTAFDKAGNSSSATVSLNVDLTPPQLSVTSPADGAVVTTPGLPLIGSVSDALSGVASVACNGGPASLSGASFSCTLSLVSGPNPIAVQATDVAGNTASMNLTVTFQAVPRVPPTAILITPGEMSLVLNQSRTVRLVDNTGSIVPGATWTTTDPTIFQISPGDPPVLTAAGTGQATLIARFSNLSSSALVSVFPGPDLPAGTMPWVIPPLTPNGFFTQFVQVQSNSSTATTFGAPIGAATQLTALRSAATSPILPDLVAVDFESSFVVRAFTADGQQLWMHVLGGNATTPSPTQTSQISGLAAPAVPSNLKALRRNQWNAIRRLLPNSPGSLNTSLSRNSTVKLGSQQALLSDAGTFDREFVVATAAANDGSIILTTTGLGGTGLVKLDGATGNLVWQGIFSPPFEISSLAIHPAGALYTLHVDGSNQSLIAVDGDTGHVKFSIPLPVSSSTFFGAFRTLFASGGVSCQPPFPPGDPRNPPPQDFPLTFGLGGVNGPIAGPIVGADGAAYLLVTSETVVRRCNGPDTSKSSLSLDEKAQLLRVMPDGSFSSQTLDTATFNGVMSPFLTNLDPFSFGTESLIADNTGGILAGWDKRTVLFDPSVPPIDPSSGISLLPFRAFDEDKVSRIENGVPTYTTTFPPPPPGLVDFQGQPEGALGRAFVVGSDNTAYGWADLDRFSLGIQAFDASTGAPKWLYPTTIREFDLNLLAAQDGGGVVAEVGNQVVRLDPNGQPTIDDWNVAGPAPFFPMNFDNIEPGDQIWFGFRDSDFAFGPIDGVPAITEDDLTDWARPQANKQNQNAASRLTEDIIVVGWIDGSSIDFPPASSVSRLTSKAFNPDDHLTCGASVLLLSEGARFGLVSSDADRQYINAFLLANSANSRPGNVIDADSLARKGDFRLFNRFQAKFTGNGAMILNPSYIQSQTIVGNTPDPCKTGLASPSPGQVNPDSGSKGLTISNAHIFQLAEGRVGDVGQRVNFTLNWCTDPVGCNVVGFETRTPWIWSAIRFDSSGKAIPSPDHQVFPTYYIYEDGKLVGIAPQSDAQAFAMRDGISTQVSAKSIQSVP